MIILEINGQCHGQCRSQYEFIASPGDPVFAPVLATLLLKPEISMRHNSMMAVFRRDPCGVTCLFMTYGAVLYADYVVVRYIKLSCSSKMKSIY